MKFSSIIAAASVVLVTQADLASFQAAINRVIADSNQAANDVSRFAASQGLIGALGIQRDSTSLSNDMSGAISAASTLTINDSAGMTATYAQLTNPVVRLLQTLAYKQSAFAQVGAANIVRNDLTELQAKSNQLQGILYRVVRCADQGSLLAANQAINNEYVRTNAAYGVANQTPPTATCS